MSKLNADAFLARTTQTTTFKESFEEREAAPSTATFRQEFVAAPLSKDEDNAIQTLLHESYVPNNADEHEVEVDYKTLANLTQQIRAIDRQGVLLHGERINKARDLLRKYRDGAFTSWLRMAYGNRQTPYRMLHFYELFQKLEREDRPLLEKMPRKSAYTLAMREGDLSKKVEIIRDHHNEKPEQIAAAIQAILPLPEGDRRGNRKSDDEVIVKALEDGIRKLSKRKGVLSDSTRAKLLALAREIQELLTM